MSKYIEISINVKEQCGDFHVLILFEKRVKMFMILHTYPPMKMEQGVTKCRHIKFRCWGITQKEA